MIDGWSLHVDARPEAGGGHIARSLVLGRALACLGDTRVLLHGTHEKIRFSATDERLRVLNASEAAPERVFGCIIDGYAFPDSTIQQWRKQSDFLVQFVDDGEPTDLVDAAIMLSREAAAGPSHLRVFSGLRYALVDPAFLHGAHDTNTAQRPDIAVCFGRRDSKNGTALALRALAAPDIVHRIGTVHVVIGSSAPHLTAAKNVARALPLDVRWRIDDTDVPALFRKVGLIIGAGGVGLIERMASGIASVTLTTASNQRSLARIAHAAGATLDIGKVDEVSADSLSRSIVDLLATPSRRIDMQVRGRNLVDGRGAERLANELAALDCSPYAVRMNNRASR
jgi:spore coat polysaccharide biosynthesis predicted glycosyltransferase SpsG